MGRLTWSRLRRRPGRAATLIAGILVASTSFTLLTATVRTSQLNTVGLVQRNARSAYDILVRPPGARSPLERQAKLVQDNFLSGIYGGITLRQYHQIAKINEVAAAAPVANLGYTILDSFQGLGVRRYLTKAPFQAFRLRLTYVIGDRQHVFHDASIYIYVTRDPIVSHRVYQTGGYNTHIWEAQGGRKLATCAYFDQDPDGIPITPTAMIFGANIPNGPKHVKSAFDPRLRSSLNCSSQRNGANYDDLRGIAYANTANVELPVEVTAIDPVQWDRLIGLDHALVSGRMLRQNEGTVPYRGGLVAAGGIPVLLTSRPYASETLDVQMQRLLPASPADLPARLNTPAAYRYLTTLPGQAVGSLAVPLTTIYNQAVGPIPTQYEDWMPGQVSYRRQPDGTLSVSDLGRQPARVWSAEISAAGFDSAAPIENTAPQVRRITEIAGAGNGNDTYLPVVVGRFDPRRLRGFSSLSQVPLETFRAPEAVGADPASAAALHGQPLQPDRNLGGYLEQPPAMLTTLGAIPFFIQSRSLTPGASRELAAPISAIMIKVSGVTGIDPLSRARVSAVASAIHRLFPRLTLDVTLGSSPQPQTIALPAGLVASSAVRVREGWARIGVALAIAQAVDRKSAILFLLVLVVCGLFLGHATFAAVRNRASEIGTLRSLGWSSAEVFRLVLAEPATAGLIAGVGGAGLAAILIDVLRLKSPPWYPLVVIPIAALLSIASGALPAWRATRIGPLEAINRPIRVNRRTGPVHGLGGLALRDLNRTPGRTMLGVLALALAVGALTILLAVTVAFRGEISFSLLGAAVIAQARQVDYISAILALVLAVAGTVDVLIISLRERAPELAMLRASGWSQAELCGLVLAEGLGTGLAGGIIGAAAGLVTVVALGGGVPVAIVITALAAAVGGAALIMIASTIPATRLTWIAPVSALADE